MIHPRQPATVESACQPARRWSWTGGSWYLVVSFCLFVRFLCVFSLFYMYVFACRSCLRFSCVFVMVESACQRARRLSWTGGSWYLFGCFFFLCLFLNVFLFVSFLVFMCSLFFLGFLCWFNLSAWWQIILDRLCFLIFFSLIIYLYMKQRESTRLIDNFERWGWLRVDICTWQGQTFSPICLISNHILVDYWSRRWLCNLGRVQD